MRAAWTLAVALVAILCLKIFVCDVKHVESGSMEPAIYGSREGGESVLVLFGSFRPERFDCVVLQRDGEDVPIVKRAVGLPEESLRISQGDLLVDGRHLPPSAPRPPPILVFDGTRRRPSESFEPARGNEPRWKESDGEWVVDARGVPAGSRDGLASFHPALQDDYLAADGSLVRGHVDVNDALFECEVAIRDSEWGVRRGRILVELVEQGDVFRFTLERSGDRESTARIARVRADSAEEILATKTVTFGAGGVESGRLRCTNVDNALGFEIESGGASQTVCHEYAENTFDENDRLKEGKTFGVRVRFGGEGGVFAFRSVRILRDVYYVPLGAHGVGAPAELGPNEYFVLGDNSASSRDSREWGPVQASKILGRPLCVVWPPSAVRRLAPAVPGPCGR